MGFAMAQQGGVWSVLRAWNERRSRAVAERQMEVRERLSLGGKRELALVRVGERNFLVGMGADGVQTMVAVDETSAPVAQPMWKAGF